MSFLVKVLRTAQKIYPHFGYYGEMLLGLTITDVKNQKLGFPSKYRIHENYICERPVVYVERNLKVDELHNLQVILEGMFQDLCRFFGLVRDENFVSRIVKDILPIDQ